MLQGLTSSELQIRHPELRNAYRRVGFFDQIPGGETALARRDRSVRVLSAVASRHPDATVVVVTHGGFLAGFLEYVLDIPSSEARRFAKAHARLNYFEYSAVGWRLDRWNDVAHLEDFVNGSGEKSNIQLPDVAG